LIKIYENVLGKRRREMKKSIDLLFDLLRADGSIVVNKKLARGIGIQPAIEMVDRLKDI